jgi:hypothetical protein
MIWHPFFKGVKWIPPKVHCVIQDIKEKLPIKNNEESSLVAGSIKISNHLLIKHIHEIYKLDSFLS